MPRRRAPRCSTSPAAPPRQGDGDEGRALVLDDPDDDPWAVAPGHRRDALLGRLRLVAAGPGADVASTAAGGALRADRGATPTGRRTRPRAFADAGMHAAAHATPDDGARDLVPLRRRPARLPVASPPTATPTPCRSRCATTASTSSPTPARTATTASPSGGSVPLHRGAQHARARRRRPVAQRAARSCGPGTRAAALSARSPARRRCSAGGRARRLPAAAHPAGPPPPRHPGLPGASAHRDRHGHRSIPGTVAGERSSGTRSTTGPGAGVQVTWQLGPDVQVELDGALALLSWPGGAGRLRLPEALTWTAHRGETDPIRGWYSPGFGERVPATVLTGRSGPSGLSGLGGLGGSGSDCAATVLVTELYFQDEPEEAQ